NHEHVPHMKELLGNVIIIIDDLSFRYQSDNIQEFTTILRKFNPQTFIHVCEKHIIATIYNKTSLKSYCNVKNIQVKKKFIKKYQTKLTQDEIDILISRYLKAGKYIRKLKNGGAVKVNLIDYILQSIKKNNKKKIGTRNISVKKYMTQSTTEVSVKSCSISKFNTLNTLFRNYRQEYKDKNFMDDIIDKFVNKLKILINDEDDKIPSDEKKNCWNNQ
ncbi:3819_t:CDS:2, partial [Gigaspora rosea]